LAGLAWVDWLFMFGPLGIGVAFILASGCGPDLRSRSMVGRIGFVKRHPILK
jgi:hypothetical protein